MAGQLNFSFFFLFIYSSYLFIYLSIYLFIYLLIYFEERYGNLFLFSEIKRESYINLFFLFFRYFDFRLLSAFSNMTFAHPNLFTI